MAQYNIANLLTYFRLGTVPFFALALALEWYVVAFLLFSLAGCSDLVDGYFARKYGQNSRFGAILDPIADKLLMAATFIGLATLHIIPWWFVILMLVKDIFIMSGIAYFKLAQIPFHYGSLFWSKATTLLLIIMGVFALLDLAFPNIALIGTYPVGDFVVAGTYITAILMIVTTLEYLRQGLEILAKRSV